MARTASGLIQTSVKGYTLVDTVLQQDKRISVPEFEDIINDPVNRILVCNLGDQSTPTSASPRTRGAMFHFFSTEDPETDIAYKLWVVKQARAYSPTNPSTTSNSYADYDVRLWCSGNITIGSSVGLGSMWIDPTDIGSTETVYVGTLLTFEMSQYALMKEAAFDSPGTNIFSNTDVNNPGPAELVVPDFCGADMFILELITGSVDAYAGAQYALIDG